MFEFGERGGSSSLLDVSIDVSTPRAVQRSSGLIDASAWIVRTCNHRVRLISPAMRGCAEQRGQGKIVAWLCYCATHCVLQRLPYALVHTYLKGAEQPAHVVEERSKDDAVPERKPMFRVSCEVRLRLLLALA